MAYGDLISTSQALSGLPAVLTAAQSAMVPTLVSAASAAVQRYCRRWFLPTDYDEVLQPTPGQWDRGEPDRAFLREFPVRRVSRVASGRSDGLTVRNTSATTNQRATAELLPSGDPNVQLSPVGLKLTRVASGVTSASLFAFGTPRPEWFSGSAAGTSGSLAAADYTFSYTIVDADSGSETLRSASITVTATLNSTVTLALPPVPPWASGLNVYASTAGGGRATETKQNGSNPVTASTYAVASVTAGGSPPSASYATVTSVANAVNALGNGWAATVGTNLGNWAATDLIAPFGPMGVLSPSAGSVLSLYTSDLGGPSYSVVPDTGEARFRDYPTGSGTNDWAVFPTDTGQVGGTWRPEVRVLYNAGFGAIPYDVVQATQSAVQGMFNSLVNSGYFQSERIGDYSYTLAHGQLGLTDAARSLLAPYVRWGR